MIAPLRQTPVRTARETTGEAHELREARRKLASILWLSPGGGRPGAARVADWRAWLFAAWVSVAATACVARLFGLW